MLTSRDVVPLGALLSAAMVLQLFRQTHQSLVRHYAQIRCTADDGFVGKGHHHEVQVRELRLPLGLLLGKRPSTLAVFRTPKPDGIQMIPRSWSSEAEVLRALNSSLPDVPTCLLDIGTSTLVAYVPGTLLAKVVPPEDGTYGSALMSQLADFFRALADVPKTELPELPADWPRDGDCQGFLERLARFGTEDVYRPNLDRFGALFDAVGAPRHAVERFMTGVPALTARPFSLLHADVHPHNIVLWPRKDGDRPVVLDWESALYGDPLHDLATHLVRMGYVDLERDAMIGHWMRAMRPRHPEMTEGLAKDLPTYMAFERVQSVYTDVMRAALELLERPDDPQFAPAAVAAFRAVRVARRALELEESPARLSEVEAALRQWFDQERRAALACGHGEGVREGDDKRATGRRGPEKVIGLLGGLITGWLTPATEIQW